MNKQMSSALAQGDNTPVVLVGSNGKFEAKVIDFSGAVANNYLVTGQVNLLAVMPGNILDKVPLTWNSVSFTDAVSSDASATYNTWRATPGTANLRAWCRRRTGYVKAQIILYGYYDPSLTNNNN